MLNPGSCILNDIFGFICLMATAVFCSRIQVWEVILYRRNELTLLGKLENQLSSVLLILSLGRVQKLFSGPHLATGVTLEQLYPVDNIANTQAESLFPSSYLRPSLTVKASVCDISYEAFPLNILNVISRRSLKILKRIIYYFYPTELNKLCFSYLI